MGFEECKSWINEIDWDMIQEDAVTIHLEWGNNNFKSAMRAPRTNDDEYSVYFVVNTWDTPKVSLMKMNNYGSQTLCEKNLPSDMAERYMKEIGGLRGIHELNEEIRNWLHKELEKP